MPDPTKMIIVRPHSCHYCGNGYFALGHVVDYANLKGWNVTDLTDDQANKGPIYDALNATDAGLFYGFGHGSNCYSEDTQILTEDGWKHFYELKDEAVATLNRETQELEYQKPTRCMAYPHKGEMFHQKGRAIDLLVTPNHNLYVSWLTYDGKYKPFQFLKPIEMKNGISKENGHFIKTDTTCGRLKYKRDAKWNGMEREFFTLPSIQKIWGHESEYTVDEAKFKMDDWLEFFGYWIAEGSACLGYADKNKKYINYRVTIAQNDNEKREKIKACMKRLGFSFGESGNDHCKNLESRDKQLYEYLRQFGHASDKFIPKEIKALSSRQLKILFDALILGDGSIGRNQNHFIYTTISKQLADDVQEMAFKIGRAATINIKNEQEKNIFHNNQYTLTIGTKNGLNPLCGKEFQEFIQYDGTVYCVEVPNHIIYVRRNGKPVWCGNSVYTGDMEQPIFDASNEDISILNGRSLCLLSCLTANVLGTKIVQAGANYFAGYNISWTWQTQGGTDGDPYEDYYARCYWESANELWVAICDGKTFEEAVAQCINKYTEWIDIWYNSGDPSALDQITWLIHDRDGLCMLTQASPYPPSPPVELDWQILAPTMLVLGMMVTALWPWGKKTSRSHTKS